MKINEVLKELELMPPHEDILYLKKESAEIVKLLKKYIKKNREKAEVFIGGSFAKNTLVKSDKYDVDIFVRFKGNEDEISGILEKISKAAAKEGKYKFEKVHGSRDYFKLWKDKKAEFEIVPVLKIKRPAEAKNVTDLSYFHVGYIKKKINAGIAREIIIAKQFCEAQGVYGAESYINGFSGYGLECLLAYYKKFEKMLRALAGAKEKILIDSEKKYKNKSDAMIELNESKLKSPIILIDPTWKERNALAALSQESFEKFAKAANEFLRKPSLEFFEIKRVSKEEIENYAKKHGAEFLHLGLCTEKQAGDIAGTKMKKFSEFLAGEISRYFEIMRKEFAYSGKQDADAYFALKSRKEIEKKGPPIEMKDECKNFKEENKNVFERGGRLYAKEKIDFSGFEFMKKWIERKKENIQGMGIAGIRIV